MYEIERYGGGFPLLRSSGARHLNKLEEAVANQVAIAETRLDGLARLTERAMQRVAEVDYTRRRLAGDDEVLNEVFGQYEMGFIRQGLGIQANMLDR